MKKTETFGNFMRRHWHGECNLCSEPAILTIPSYDDPLHSEPIMLCDSCRIVVFNIIAPLSASIDSELDNDRQILVILETVMEIIRRKQDCALDDLRAKGNKHHS